MAGEGKIPDYSFSLVLMLNFNINLTLIFFYFNVDPSEQAAPGEKHQSSAVNCTRGRDLLSTKCSS